MIGPLGRKLSAPPNPQTPNPKYQVLAHNQTIPKVDGLPY